MSINEYVYNWPDLLRHENAPDFSRGATRGSFFVYILNSNFEHLHSENSSIAVISGTHEHLSMELKGDGLGRKFQ